MEEIDLLELWNYFRAKILWVVLAVVVALVVGNTFTILTRVPEYQSTTSVVLVGGDQNNSNANASYYEIQNSKNLVSTYSQIIKSRKVLNKVISNLGIDYSVDELVNHVNVISVDDTAIIKISVTDAKPKNAALIANEIARVFMVEVQKIYRLDNVTVIDKALEANTPYNVNYVKDNLIYLAVGLVLSCGIIFVLFYLDTTIKTSEEIEERLGLTVIGIVPDESKE